MAVAGVLALALAFLMPRHLKIATDIVGYPIYADFNVEWIIDLYYIGVVFFPVSALVAYLAQTWLGSRWGLNEPLGASAQSQAAIEAPVTAQRVGAVAALRVIAVGVSFAVEVAIVVEAGPAYIWVVVAAVVVAYAGIVAAAAVVAQRLAHGRGSLVSTIARVNTLLAPLALVGLLAVSASTTVTVLSDHSVHHYEWIPWWIVVPLAAGTLGWLWWRLSAAHSEQDVRAVERRTLLFVSAPVTLLLLLSEFQGALGPIEVFHEGEGLVAAKLASTGLLYWRDLLSTHGLLQDVLMPWLAFRLLEPSRWGHQTAYPLLFTPLALVFLYMLGAWLFEKSWAFVLALIVVILSLQFVVVDTRFIAWPLILLLLGAALQSRRAWLSAIFGVSLTVQAILVPESAYCVPACGLVIVLHDLYHRRHLSNVIETFSKTLWTIGGAAAVLAFLAGFLLTQHALGDFFFYYLIFVPGHELTGGLPLHLRAFGPLFVFFELGPPAALLIAFGYFAARVLRGLPLDTRDWVMGASALFALPYYTKFLERADYGHGVQAYGAAIPLILFLTYRATTYADALVRRSVWPRFRMPMVAQPVAVLVLVAALASVMTVNPFHAAPKLADWLAGTADRYHTVAAVEPNLPHVGYADNAIDPATVSDLQSVFNAYLRPGDWVFDFSNQPALIYYLLDQSPQVRYSNISMAISERAQKDLIAELKHDPPKLVVFTTDTYGLLNWDGIPNMVRSYDVSQYILDNYTPLLSTHTQIIYGLAAAQLSAADVESLPLQQPADTKDLAFKGFSCDWGFAPYFLRITPPAPARPLAPATLTTTADPNGIVTFEGWAGDLGTGNPAPEVVVTMGGKVVASAAPSLGRPAEAAVVGKPGFATSGYRLAATVSEQLLSNPNGMASLRVFGVSSQGVASELPGSPGATSPLAQITLGDGSAIPVRPGAVIGGVDSIIPSHQLIISPPPGTGWSDYRWLEISTPSTFGQDRWAVYDDQSGDPGHQVIFRTLGGTSTIRIYVGSCAQWHGYGAMPLFLGHSGAQDIGTVRLLT